MSTLQVVTPLIETVQIIEYRALSTLWRGCSSEGKEERALAHLDNRELKLSARDRQAPGGGAIAAGDALHSAFVTVGADLGGGLCVNQVLQTGCLRRLLESAILGVGKCSRSSCGAGVIFW